MDMIEPIDKTSLFKIGYGLYVVTTKDGDKDNGLIVNTVTQIADNPLKVAVSVNKKNYSHNTIVKTGMMNVCCLTESAPFSLFKNFGFQSGRDADKFTDIPSWRTKNGLMCIRDDINAVISLSVDAYHDMDSHGLFICSVTEAHVINDDASMTYAYYHKNVKAMSAKYADMCMRVKTCLRILFVPFANTVRQTLRKSNKKIAVALPQQSFYISSFSPTQLRRKSILASSSALICAQRSRFCDISSVNATSFLYLS